MDQETYEGSVCYRDGWHWSVTTGDDGDTPDKKLVLDESGYRFATDADTESWHDLNHKQYANVELT